MKRVLPLLLLVIYVLSVPVEAVSLLENKNQCITVSSVSEGVEETTVFGCEHLQDKELMEILELDREREDSVVPADAKICHLTMIRQKGIVSDAFPVEYTMHSWISAKRYLVALFRPEGEEAWQIVGCATGSDITFSLPSNGQYAIAWSW